MEESSSKAAALSEPITLGWGFNSLKESSQCVGKLVVKVPRLLGRVEGVLNLPEADVAFGTF